MKSRLQLFLTLWVFLFAVTTAYWIFKNNLPPSWDEAQYLAGSEILHQTLTNKGLLAFFTNTTTILGTKAPLITIIPIPFYLFFGSSPHIALLTNLIFALIFFFFLFQLVSLVFDEKIALASCIIISTMPLFYGLARYFLVEFGLTSLVTMWIFFALKTELLSNKKYLFYLGIVSALGVLIKFHFFLFIAGPAIIIFFEIWNKNKRAIFNIKNIIIFSVPVVVIALPWYARNILTILWKAKRSTDPALLGNLYYGPPFSFNNLYRSALDFINYAMSAYWFLILIILVFLFFLQRRKFKVNYLLLGWFFIPFFIFYLGPNKDYRLMLPLLPSVAILIGYLTANVFQKRFFLFLTIMIIFPVLVYLNTSLLSAKLINNQMGIGQFILGGNPIGGYVKTPSTDKWPVEDTLKFIESQNTSDVRKVVISASESEAFNINSLQYYSLHANLPLQINTASYFPKGTNYETIRSTIDKGDYILMKVGGNPGPSDLNRFNELILQNLDAKTWEEIPNNISLPDGGKIKIWKKIP